MSRREGEEGDRGAAVASKVRGRRAAQRDQSPAQSPESAAALLSILTATFDALPDPLIVYDLADHVLFSNAAARNTIPNTSPAAYLAHATAPDDDHPLPEDQWPLRRARRGEDLTGDRAIELRLHHPNGTEQHISQSASPVRDASGAVIGAVVITRDLTASHAAPHAATEPTSELSVILETMPDAVAVYSADGQVLHANAAFNELFATQNWGSDFFSRSVDERRRIVDARDADGGAFSNGESAYARILRGETLIGGDAVDIRMRRASGEEVALNVVGCPVRDASGRITKAVMVYRDVTERLRATQERARQARELEAILEALTDGVALYDAEGKIVRLNAASIRLFGYDEGATAGAEQLPAVERRQALGLRDEHDELFTDETWPVNRMLNGEVISGENGLDMIRHLPNGDALYLNLEGVPMRDASGEIIGAVAVARDVTERRRLERRTREALDALLEMAQTVVSDSFTSDSANILTLRAVARRLGDLIRNVLGCDRVAITAVDPAANEATQVLAVVGLTAAQEQRLWATLPSNAHLSDTVDPQSLARLRAGEVLTADLGETPDEARNPYRARSVLVAPGLLRGQMISVLSIDYASEPHLYTPSEIALAGAVAQLMTLVIERERLVRERAEAQASALALRESNRRLDEFMSIASHELKTPLTTIKANVQLARRRAQRLLTRAHEANESSAPELEVLHTLVARTEGAVDRQERLVNDLLDVSRIQTGKLVLNTEPIDLADITRDVVEEMRVSSPTRTITLTLPDAPVIVEANADRIHQVIANYLSNALKYSAESEPVAVELIVEGSSARLSVRDTGPGIPAKEHEHVWERFHRVEGIEHRSGSGVGLGLGLYISREIVERHNGTVGLKSQLGKGSNFWFILPLATNQP